MELYISVFATLFVVIDPIGLLPIFIALTQGQGLSYRRKVALNASLIGAVLLTVFAFAGDALLSFIGIGFPAFRIAGGMLLFLTAVEMLFNKRSKRREEDAEQEDHDDPSVFPLATPLIAGPGAITTIILMTGDSVNAWQTTAIVLAATFSVIIIAYVLFYFSNLFEKMLGQTGINVITRLLGMLLAALAIQFIIDGMRGLGVFG
ncbi:UPF0056 inner membrane protein [Amylibacter ulvae]|uniref:UPF0056 membrane protein n=2 Tax=Paramylibacter TaxID=3143987 RepID=A0A2G5K642_9RHOB|nr:MULTISPECIES: MarC family protein [Amylibacter]PIB24895.1 MarC family transcriptional regulator [Amylibacter kogurei]GHA40438.1 UPF0056 inner membrane protein [Amylibacter ulvae]